MNVNETIQATGLVPVVVIDDAAKAVSVAKALYAGGVDVMEITLRTAAGMEAIKNVSEGFPEILVGAGTVLSLEKAKEAVSVGAKFIVTPGFDEDIVRYCVDNDIAVFPGCVTPTEITVALKYGLKVLKFFPANVYGGVNAMKALTGPFGSVSFVPTGGVDLKNLADYATAPFIAAVGGGFLASKADIANENYENITKTAAAAIDIMLGYELDHVGVNCVDETEAGSVAKQFEDAFGFKYTNGNSSIFAGKAVEVMKAPGIGANGHISIVTNNIIRAVKQLKRKGFEIDETSWKEKNGKPVAVYLKDMIGGFGVHLRQK